MTDENNKGLPENWEDEFDENTEESLNKEFKEKYGDDYKEDTGYVETPTIRERATAAYHKVGDTVDRVKASDTYKGVVKAFAPRVVKRERAPARSTSPAPRKAARRVVARPAVKRKVPAVHSTHRQLQPAVRIQTFGSGPMPRIGSMGSGKKPTVKKVSTQFSGVMPRMGSFGSGSSVMPRIGSIGSGFKIPNSLDLLKKKSANKSVKKSVKRKTTKRKTVRRKRK